MADVSEGYLDTPLGRLRVIGTDEGIAEIGWVSSDEAGEEEPSELVLSALTEIAEYFVGKRRAFSMPLAPEGTPFQQRVWGALAQIPFANRSTYGAIAQRLGDGGAARAVGAATGANPLAIVVPCHRVVSATGALTGYSFGVTRKKWLLDHESRVASGDPFVTLEIGPSRRIAPRAPRKAASVQRKRDRSIGEW